MENPNIHDITAPGEFLPEPTYPWWVWAIAAASVAFIIILVILWLRKPDTAKERSTLLDDARARLAKIKEKAPNMQPHTIATETSLVIRRYLVNAFKDPAIFETTEEFTLRPQALAKLPPNSQQPIKDYLTKISELKYSPSLTTNASQLVDEAESLLANIEINFSPAEA